MRPGPDATPGSWRMAGADLGQQLHYYGHLCLWRTATRTGLPADGTDPEPG